MSALEAHFAQHVKAIKLPEPKREYRFDPTRRWRIDFAWPEKMVAVEIEGGVWTGGRHTRGSGFVADLEKYNRATVLGWKVLRFDADTIKSGEAIQIVQKMLGGE